MVSPCVGRHGGALAVIRVPCRDIGILCPVPGIRVVPGLTDEQVRWATIALAERAARHYGWSWDGARLFPTLAGRKPAWTVAEVRRLLDLGLEATPYSVVTVLRVAAGAAEALDPAERRPLTGRFAAARLRVDEPAQGEAGERARLRMRLALLTDSLGGASTWRGRIHVEDGWSRAAVACLAASTAGRDAVRALLDHALALASGPRPSKA